MAEWSNAVALGAIIRGFESHHVYRRRSSVEERKSTKFKVAGSTPVVVFRGYNIMVVWDVWDVLAWVRFLVSLFGVLTEWLR